jgi:hypothetical protein
VLSCGVGNHVGLRRLPGGAEGIRTSDLRSAGTRALHSSGASDSAGEGAPLDAALDRRSFKAPGGSELRFIAASRRGCEFALAHRVGRAVVHFLASHSFVKLPSLSIQAKPH